MTLFYEPATAHALDLAACRDRIEERIIRAYVGLALTSYQVDDARSVTLARHGAFEVRLTEIPLLEEVEGVPAYWLEIYSHLSQAPLDSLGCFEFNEDELSAAVNFVWDARLRYRNLH